MYTAKILEEKYEGKLKLFSGGRGGGLNAKPKTLPWGEYGYYLSGTAH